MSPIPKPDVLLMARCYLCDSQVVRRDDSTYCYRCKGFVGIRQPSPVPPLLGQLDLFDEQR